MIHAGIVGATGYGGRELLRLLALHPEADVVAVTSTTEAGQRVDAVLPAFGKVVDLVFQPFDAVSLAKICDTVFVGVPGADSMAIVAQLRAAGVRVIDIGPDFRLKDAAAFHRYYKHEHAHPALLPESVYGLPPYYREQLRNATLVAGPGCYPIGAILPLRPLVEAAQFETPIVIDAVSGVSGAGRSLKEPFHFSEMNDNVWAYKVGEHQHIPEIEQELGHKVMVQFSPHVGPYTRGILSTITARPASKLDLNSLYARYDKEPFVRVLGEGKLPDLNGVRGSNFCDIGWVGDARTGNIVIVSALDNLIGGTAGIAIQCMNIMFGLNETTGLNQAGITI